MDNTDKDIAIFDWSINGQAKSLLNAFPEFVNFICQHKQKKYNFTYVVNINLTNIINIAVMLRYELSNKYITDLGLSDMKINSNMLKYIAWALGCTLPDCAPPDINFKNIYNNTITLTDLHSPNNVLTVLRLDNNRIGDDGIYYLADALKYNNTITHLYLASNGIGPKGLSYIAKALRTNSSLIDIDISRNNIGDNQNDNNIDMINFANALKINTTLTEIDMFQNNIDHLAMTQLAKGLNNNHITTIGLSNNNIGDNGLISLADALKNNYTMVKIILFNNNIGDAGVISLANALTTNSTLSYLILDSNKISNIGISHIANMLKNNTSITNLTLNTNNIGDDGATSIAEALEINSTLQVLDLSNNNIGDLGLSHMADSLIINQNMKLSTLNIYGNKNSDIAILNFTKSLEYNSSILVLGIRYIPGTFRIMSDIGNRNTTNKYTKSLSLEETIYKNINKDDLQYVSSPLINDLTSKYSVYRK